MRRYTVPHDVKFPWIDDDGTCGVEDGFKAVEIMLAERLQAGRGEAAAMNEPFDECEGNTYETDIYIRGRTDATAEIVAWLRRGCLRPGAPGERLIKTGNMLADEIERGELVNELIAEIEDSEEVK